MGTSADVLGGPERGWLGGGARRFRVLHLIAALGGGGAEQQLWYLAEEHARGGHDIHIGYLHLGPSLGIASPDRVRLHPLHALNNHDPRLLWQIVSLVRRLQPDLVQTWILQMDIFGGWAARITSTPWILREPSSRRAYLGSWKFWLRRRLGIHAHTIVANSEGGRCYWSSPPSVDCRVIPNGIPFDDIAAVPPTEREQITPHGERLVVYAGRLHRDKKLDTLIQAMSHVVATMPSVLLICGDGPAGPDLKRLAGSLGLAGRVGFLGHLPRKRLLALLKTADLFAFPSAYEGQPNVVLEAIACGCPIAVSDIPAHREFLTEACSLFVDPYDAEGLAHAISEALAHPEEARARAALARERVNGWSTVCVAEEYARVYETVLARRQQVVQSTNSVECSAVETQRRTGPKRLADET